MTKRLNQRQYAKHRGLSAPRISQLVKSGKIPIGEDGKICVGTADAILDGRPLRGDADSGAVNYNNEKALHEQAKRKLAELKVEEAEGRLVPVEVVTKAIFTLNRAVRDAILGVPSRVSAKAAATSNANEIERMIYDELAKALSALSEDGSIDLGRAGDNLAEDDEG